MDIQFSVEFNPGSAELERELKSDIQKIAKNIVKEVVELAPFEMKDLMTDNPPSAFGSPPAKRTGKLFNSLQGRGDTISMAGHAFYLDPIFTGTGKGGGWANRPFIERGIDKALVKIAKPL